MLAWFDTEDARRTARRLAARRGLGGYDAIGRNLLDDARVAVWSRMQRDEELNVARPGAYGTTVLRSVLRQTAQGRRIVDLVDPTDPTSPLARHDAAQATSMSGPDIDTSADELRLLVELETDGRHWVTSAALSYLTLLQRPEARPEAAPWPRAGATEDQARCWPSLWFAGEREMFAPPLDDRDAARLRRTRSRRIGDVLDRIQAVVARYRLDLTRGRTAESEQSRESHDG